VEETGSNYMDRVAYGGGDEATGDEATGDDALDILSVGVAVIQGMQFGIMYDTTVLEGILGVSFTEIESVVAFRTGLPMTIFRYC
jgi:hypothetical protein